MCLLSGACLASGPSEVGGHDLGWEGVHLPAALSALNALPVQPLEHTSAR